MFSTTAENLLVFVGCVGVVVVVELTINLLQIPI
jgi:hypothetical protein